MFDTPKEDTTDNPARTPIRQVPTPEQNQVASGGSVASVKGAEAAKQRIKGKRGPKPKDKIAAEALAASQQVAAQISKILTPDNCKAVVRLPGDVMLAVTGNEIWNVTDREAENMAGPLGVAIEQMALQDPKMLAITMFMFSITTVYLTRTMQYLKTNKKVKGSNADKDK